MSFLEDRLTARRTAGTYRELPGSVAGVDFWSNDYLGFARDRAPVPPANEAFHGTGSRLIAGDRDAYRQLEDRIARFHGYPAALVFGSGYLANTGLLSALGRRTDTFLYDELIHASCRDGIRLSAAAGRRFRHNDTAHLAQLLAAARPDGQRFVVTEGRFSMDGDRGGVAALVEVCDRHGAHLIVDEAHSVGIEGTRGAGLVAELGLQSAIFATVITYGKAPGYHGAAVLGGTALRAYLINHCRPFIYTTAPPPDFWRGLNAVYDRLETEQPTRVARLQELIRYFRAGAQEQCPAIASTPGSPIQLWPIPGNDRVLRADGARADDQGAAARDQIAGEPHEFHALLGRLRIIFPRRAGDDDAVHAGIDQAFDRGCEGIAVEGEVGAVGRDDGRVDALELHDRPFPRSRPARPIPAPKA